MEGRWGKYGGRLGVSVWVGEGVSRPSESHGYELLRRGQQTTLGYHSVTTVYSQCHIPTA